MASYIENLRFSDRTASDIGADDGLPPYNNDTFTTTYTETKACAIGKDGIRINYDLDTATPKYFEMTKDGVAWTDGITPYTTGLGRLAAVQTALASVELPPNSTTLKLNDTLLCDNGTATTSVSSTSIAMTNPASDIVGSYVGNGFNLTTDATGISVGTSTVNASAINSAGTLQSSLSGSVVNMPSPPYPAPDANWSLSVNSTTKNPSLYLSSSAPFTNTTSMTIDLNNITHNQSTGSVSPDDNFTISTNKNLIMTADNFDLNSTGRAIFGSLANPSYAQMDTNKLTIQSATTGGVANPMLTLTQNDTASGSAGIRMYKNISTNGSSIGEIGFIAKTAITGNPEREYARIGSTIRSNTSGNVDGAINLSARINDTLTECMRINGQDSQIEIYQPLDLNDKDIVSSTGDIELNATSSAGNGKIILRPKEVSGTETISMPLTSSLTDELVIEKSANATTFYQTGGALANSNAFMRLGYGGLRMTTANASVAPTFGLDNTSFQTAEHQFVGTNYNLTLPSAGEVNLINANLDLNGGSLTSSTGTIPINATTLNFQNTSTQTTPANHNVIFYARTNGLQGTNWLKVQLNGNFIWIPYLTIDPNV